MAIDPRIALGVRNIELPAPTNNLAQYAQMQQIQSGQAEQQMNALKMQEYERTRAEEEGARNYLSGADLTKPETQAGLLKFGKTGMAYGKALTEADTAASTRQKSQFDLEKAKREFVAQAQRDTSRNPSDANITAFKEDLMMNPAFTDAEKAQMAAGADRILAMPVDQRQAFMESQGASAGERMQQGTATANREQTAATALAGQGVTMRGQNMTAGTAATQGDLNRAATATQGELNREAKNTGEAQKPMTALQQQSFRKAKAGDTVSVRAAETTVSELERLTDSLVGNPEKGIAPHPGLGGATGYSGLLYSLPKGEARKAEQQLETFKGKIMAFGRQLASQEGKLGNMAVQEWKFVSDAIQKIDTSAGNLDDQMRDVVRQAKNAAATIREKYDLTYEDTGAESPTDRATPMQPADKQALEWANANAGDPRAAQIKQRLGR